MRNSVQFCAWALVGRDPVRKFGLSLFVEALLLGDISDFHATRPDIEFTLLLSVPNINFSPTVDKAWAAPGWVQAG